jgi:hypothetical protein
MSTEPKKTEIYSTSLQYLKGYKNIHEKTTTDERRMDIDKLIQRHKKMISIKQYKDLGMNGRKQFWNTIVPQIQNKYHLTVTTPPTGNIDVLDIMELETQLYKNFNEDKASILKIFAETLQNVHGSEDAELEEATVDALESHMVSLS